jgi:hypothetical protein
MKTTSDKTQNRVSAVAIALAVVAVTGVSSPFAKAEDITIADLAGSWQVA